MTDDTPELPDPSSPLPPGRRAFLAGSLAGIAAAAAACSDDDGDASGTTTEKPTTTAATSTAPGPELPGNPFTLGVASGDPLDDAVILWTMLAPKEGEMPAEDVEVLWELAADDRFEQIVASGAAPAPAAYGHSVHVDATGLAPATAYHYRFTVGEYTSPAGRTLTTAADGDAPVRLAVTTCQGFGAGYYTAYRSIADQELDAVVMTGDFIYEFEMGDVRPTSFETPADLDGYRTVYLLGVGDADLQAARAAHPWISTWDDHEVEDNYAGLEPGEIGRAQGQTAEGFAAKRAAAYQAWYEFQPVRAEAPTGPDLKIFRSFRFGDVATLAVLDGRQYRDIQAIDDTFTGLDRIQMTGPITEGAKDPSRTYLGTEQADWLIGEVTEADTTWKVLAQQSVMGGWNLRPDLPEGRWSLDTWDGYPAERARLLTAFAEGGVDNLVSVGGDIHSSIVQELRLDPTSTEVGAERIGTEFITPSITSAASEDEAQVQLMATAEYVKLYNATDHGYVTMTFTMDEATADYTWVEPQPGAVAVDGPSFKVEAGTTEIVAI